jgi:hypothetical protein
MKNIVYLTLLSTIFVNQCFANVGIFEYYINYSNNSVTTNCGNYGGGISIHEQNLGSFSNIVGTLSFINIGIKTFENSGDWASDAKMYYRVYLEGSVPGTFEVLSLSDNGYISGGDKLWKYDNFNIVDKIDSDSYGTYVIELYFEVTGNYNGGSWTPPAENNGGDNFKPTFEYKENVIVTDHTFNSDVTFENLVIDAQKTLTIDKTASVTITGNFTNNGTFTLDSDSDEFSSIIIDGTPSGNITYNRWVNSVDNGTTGWDLVGSPASGVTISSIIGDSDLATNGSSPTTYALGSFDNTDLSWSNVDSDDTSGTLTSGQGYQMATTSGGTITFNGSVLTTTQTVSITNNNPNDNGDSNLTGSRWNLIANPFPSYINANTSADSNHNFLSDNLGGSINNNYTALYAYDANGGYTPINNTSAATYIAPGQGILCRFCRWWRNNNF